MHVRVLVFSILGASWIAACGGGATPSSVATSVTGSDAGPGTAPSAGPAANSGNISSDHPSAEADAAPCVAGSSEFPCVKVSHDAGLGEGGIGPTVDGGDGGSTLPDGAACTPPALGTPAPVALEDDVPIHGQECMACHTTPVDDSIPQFQFGGRVYDLVGNPVPGAQVIGRGANGQDVAVISNDDGYFWYPPPPDDGYGGDDDDDFPPITFPAAFGVQPPGGSLNVMCTLAPTGACNSCHTVNAAAIH